MPTPPIVLNTWNSTIVGLGVHHLWKLDETSGDALDTGATAGFDMTESSGSNNRWRLAPGPIRGQPREYALWGSQSLGGALKRTSSGLAATGFSTGGMGAVIYVYSTNAKITYIVQQIYNSAPDHKLELTVELDGSFQMIVENNGVTNRLIAKTAAGLAVDGTAYVVMGFQRADGTGLRIYVDGIDVTDSNVITGAATLNSFPNDLLAGQSASALSINANNATTTAQGGALISNPFVFVNSVPTTSQIATLAASAIIDTTQLSDYFETVFSLSEQAVLFWVPGWVMNANADAMEVGLNQLETNVQSASAFTGLSSLNNPESGGVGKQIISQFNNYYSKYGASNSAFNSFLLNTSTVGTFNFVGRIGGFNVGAFNTIFNYANGGFPGGNFTAAFFHIVGSSFGYKFAFRLQLVGGDFFQALSGSFITADADAITMFTVVQDGTGVLFYIDGVLVSTDDTSSGTTYDANDWTAAVDAQTGITASAIGGGSDGDNSSSNFEPNEIHDLFMLDKVLTSAEIETLWNAVNGIFPAVGGGAFHTLLLITGNDGTGPDHYWRMNDVTSVLADSGIRPNRAVDPITGATIQKLGNPLQNQISPIPDDDAAASILFDGALDAYEVGVNGVSGSLIDNSEPSQTGSIGFFFLPTSLLDSNIVYSQGDTSYGSFLQVGFNQDKLEVIVQRSANNKVTVTSGNSVSSTVFNFVVITCDGSEYRLYLNGRQDPETTTFVQGSANKGDWFRAIITTLSALSAKGTTGFTTETTGNVSEVFIYDPDVLTPEEIVDLFDAAVVDGFTGETITEFHRTGITSASHSMVIFDSEMDA